jgi:uncharacterized protein (TIGR03437 family)
VLQASIYPVGVVGVDYPLQILTAVGGKLPYRFSISDGVLPPGLNFSSPEFNGIPTVSGFYAFTVTVTDTTGSTASGPGSILISPANPDLILSQSILPFYLTVGSGATPAPASVTVRSSLVQQLLNYQVTVTPSVPWLDVASGSTTPSSIGISLNAAALQLPVTSTPYKTTVLAICQAPSPCANVPKQISIELSVSAPPPAIALTDSLISFQSAVSTPATQSRTIGIQNTGGGELTINSVSARDAWVTVSSAPASVVAGRTSPIVVSANPAGLAAGYYTSAVAITTPAGVGVLTVTLDVVAAPRMTPAPSGAQFQTTVDSAPGNSNGGFLLTLSGSTQAAWTAQVVTGYEWLSTTTPSGVSTSTAPGQVLFSIDAAGYAGRPAQTYYGTIRIISPDIANSPLDFNVVLDVESGTALIRPDPSPAGLVFILGAAGGATSKSVTVYASSSVPLAYQASASTEDGADWLRVSPAMGVASAASPGASSVTVNAIGLAPGVYRGGVSYALSAAAVRTVGVTLIVTSTGASSAASHLVQMRAAAACTPTMAVPAQLGLAHNFQQPAGWPAGIAVMVVTDCGTPLTNVQVTTSFSNGDPPIALTLADPTSGVFWGTWTPRTVSPQVSVVSAVTGTQLATSAEMVIGQVMSNTAPIIAPNGVLHIFNAVIGGALAPGTAVQIYGTNLADAPLWSDVPLATSLGGTSVLIGGIVAPLYYVGPGQIDAQIPFGLAAGRQYQVQVNANGGSSTPAVIELLGAAPGIAAYANGQAIAQHTDYSLVTDESPAAPGDYVVIYLAGLGAVDQSVASGAGSPANPLASPLDVPSLLLNGSAIPVVFAGLSPSSVGLYQINFRLPAGTAGGDALLQIQQSTGLSNAVTLPVRQ